MPPVDRNNPVRGEGSDSQFTLMEFLRKYGTDAKCLDWLWRTRYAPDGHTAECPKCERPRKFHRVASRPSYSCDSCGHHLHPTAGTIFHKSSTSLHLWFYAMYLMASTKTGLAAKQLEREIGVSYKTAWRMLNLIRTQLMEQDDVKLSGDVEVDETLGGGNVRAGDARRGLAYVHKSHRPTVWAAVERGGRVKAKVVRSRASSDVEGPIYENVEPESIIFTDEWKGYDHFRLSSRFIRHERIRHEDRIYVQGHVHTQTVEGFFGNVKGGIRGVYHGVSRRWLNAYLNEYAWRYSNRFERRAMFDLLLLRTLSD
jgi:transposase-like protein